MNFNCSLAILCGKILIKKQNKTTTKKKTTHVYLLVMSENVVYELATVHKVSKGEGGSGREGKLELLA